MNKETRFPRVKNTQLKFELVDAAGQTLGRLATRVASILRGKDLTSFSPHLPAGRGVVVINASRIRVTGKKMNDKIYYHHTGYHAGLRQKKLKEVLARHPDRVISYAVWGMLPKGALGRVLIKRLKVYAGSEHKQKAQLEQPPARPEDQAKQ